MMPVLRFHRHTDKPQTIPLGIGDQRASRLRSKPGLSAQTSFVSIFRIHKHLMLLDQLYRFFFFICFLNDIYRFLKQRPEFFICICQPGNLCHVISRCIVIVVVQAIRIGKMGILTSDIRRCLIHQLSKGRNRTGYGLCQSAGNLIGRNHHQRMKRLVYRKDFAFLHSDIHIQPYINAVQSLFHECNFSV